MPKKEGPGAEAGAPQARSALTPGLLTAQFAVLVSEFKLTLPEISDLTPRQIKEIYFHARDKDGAIEGPVPAPVTADPRARLHQLLALAPALGLKPDDVAKIRQRLEAPTRGPHE